MADEESLLLLLLLLFLRRRRRRRRWLAKRNVFKRKRRTWVTEIFLRRQDQGIFHNLVRELKLGDRELYFRYAKNTCLLAMSAG